MANRTRPNQILFFVSDEEKRIIKAKMAQLGTKNMGAYQKAKDKTAFRAKHEAELVIFEAAKSTLLAVQGDRKLPRMKALQAEQERLTEEQQRLYDKRAKLKKEAKQIDTIKANVDSYLRPIASQEQKTKRRSELE